MTTKEQKALFRFQVIHPLLDDRLSRGELTRLVKEASGREYAIPGSRKTTISESTIWCWYKTYIKERNIASLVPKGRNDKGKRRKITGETADRLLHVFGQAKMDKMIVGIPYFGRWTKKDSFLHRVTSFIHYNLTHLASHQ